MLQVYDLISSEDARATRRFIYRDLGSKPAELKPEEQEQVEKASVLFDRVGSLVNAGLVPQDLPFASHCEMILRLWDHLEPYIAHYRRQRESTYVTNFERLAASARIYQLRTRQPTDNSSAATSAEPATDT